jgi:hypothetical protein
MLILAGFISIFPNHLFPFVFPLSVFPWDALGYQEDSKIPTSITSFTYVAEI